MMNYNMQGIIETIPSGLINELIRPGKLLEKQISMNRAKQTRVRIDTSAQNIGDCLDCVKRREG